MDEFKRERRYFVAKLKHLTPEQIDQLEAIVKDSPPIECVVVESDWPIYDQVWDLVESVADGTAQLTAEFRERLKARKEDLTPEQLKQLSKIKTR